MDNLELPHSHGTEPAALRARLGDIERFHHFSGRASPPQGSTTFPDSQQLGTNYSHT